MNLAFIPSPGQGVWHLGPIPIRAYALCIIAGVVVAIWLGERRWVARGGKAGQVGDIAIWAVPFGLVGGRLYHVMTDFGCYFDAPLCPPQESYKGPIGVFYVWEGGLGIWGAIALGALGAWIGCRRAGIKLPPLTDALAPGIALAQAIGRWGNWFNQELFGRPTTLPWGLHIDPAHRPNGYEQYATFHPTFLYESVWDVGTALLVIWADRRFKLGHGRAFALYVMAYTVGRAWIEYLRIDVVQGSDVFGLRLNDWTSLLVFLGALGFFLVSRRRHPGREESVFRTPPEPADDAGADVAAEPATPATAEPAGAPARTDAAEDRAARPGDKSGPDEDR